MPVSLSVDAAERVLYVVFAGMVTEDDLVDSYRAIDGANGRPANAIVDTTSVEGIDVAAEMLLIGAIRRAHANGRFPEPWRVAIVAPAPTLFGIARMYQAYRESRGSPAHYLVCRTMVEARQWVEPPGPAPRDTTP